MLFPRVMLFDLATGSGELQVEGPVGVGDCARVAAFEGKVEGPWELGR